MESVTVLFTVLTGKSSQLTTGKKTPGGAGTHTGHTGHTVKRHRGEPGHTRDTQAHARGPLHADTRRTQTNLTTIQTQRQSIRTRSRTTTRQPKPETAADSTTARTAAGPEPTTPRGRLRRGRPQRSRPCLHPLPERLPAPARSRRTSAKIRRRRARQMRNGRRCGQSPR